MYEGGHGVKQSVKKAFALYQQAAALAGVRPAKVKTGSSFPYCEHSVQ